MIRRLPEETNKAGRQRGFTRWRLFLGAALIVASGAPGLAAAQANLTANAVAQRVDRHYNALHSLEVHFAQEYTGMGMDRKESGVLLLKKPGRMRWTYTNPDGKLFILDGHDGYFYSPGETEAQKVPQKQLDDLRSPLQFLLGHTDLQKELIRLTVTPGANGTWQLSGVPKGLEQRVSALKIAATADGTIQSMTIEETDGVTNRFTFTGEADNVPAPNSSFVFTPLPGVRVVTGEPPV
ncbi:MAG TPA: outer membrane lipoprotein carrier protein LolA [Acidobacteriaceae bacterium]|nr:outer membrane lipoprotein carrier protein LolA [Acidobacteriaceae bacterium]